ncbi:hypothetical protein DRJ48_00215 [Candidatus Woesearchaeota archaeon]|nr:MAG: hypothetical protein DRJ48_00215 [Candidatus Woesearchaeota archaeon]
MVLKELNKLILALIVVVLGGTLAANFFGKAGEHIFKDWWGEEEEEIMPDKESLNSAKEYFMEYMDKLNRCYTYDTFVSCKCDKIASATLMDFKILLVSHGDEPRTDAYLLPPKFDIKNFDPSNTQYHIAHATFAGNYAPWIRATFTTPYPYGNWLPGEAKYTLIEGTLDGGVRLMAADTLDGLGLNVYGGFLPEELQLVHLEDPTLPPP